ncbi:putative esophageal gland cell secretory protein 6 [Stomoxys calcitrans]|uniref:putative esophageal gland cell secretory protein 6 n=1 Tax=Stomoxys calcitrans TaxID=35570 RepID=UPI0027E2DF08|nr:putative esophageal gland cell secretory protein 6 [Stomoxys calcitrans]XP_059221959.1 putative esophageal gland cell secretory protein 6 [Stomoxys calcitrans]
MGLLLRLWACFFVCFVIHTATAVDTTKSATTSSKQDPIVPSKIISVHINYCNQSYGRIYEKYAAELQQKYPHVMVSGNNQYPSVKDQINLLFTFITYIALVYVLFRWIVRSWFKRVVLFMGTLYVSPYVLLDLCRKCLRSGAFEVFVDGVEKWSTLQKGRIPKIEEIFQIINPEAERVGEPDNSELIFLLIICGIVFMILNR